MGTALQRRRDHLIEEMENKSFLKLEAIEEQMDSLREYQSKLQWQHKVVLETKVEEMLNDKESEKGQRTLDAVNMNSKVMLNEKIDYDQERFARINRMSVEVPNYDHLVAQIKTTGIIDDEFDRCSKSRNNSHSANSTVSRLSGCNHNHNDNDNVNDHAYDCGHGLSSDGHSNELQCICGVPLILTNVDFAYSSEDKVFCQFCKHRCVVPQSGDIYHCPRGDIDAHPGGFDLCSLCGIRSIEMRKAERQRVSEEKQWEKDRESIRFMRSSIDQSTVPSLHKSRIGAGHLSLSHCRNATMIVNAVATMKGVAGSTSSVHQRSYSALRGSQWNMRFSPHELMDRDYFQHFPFPTQLKRVVEMGYDANRAKEFVLKHNGNMVAIMGELMT